MKMENGIQVSESTIFDEKSVPSVSIQPKASFTRRKLIKAPVAVNSIRRKIKEHQNQDFPKANEGNDIKFIQENIDGVPSGCDEKEENCISGTPVIDITQSKQNEYETESKNHNSCKHDESTAVTITKIPITSVTNTVQSDTEYPPPPPSPNKINRSRIKAIPRLDYRKASFSASESEDESRKNNRIRNDSICSTTSAVAESITECFSPQRSGEVPTVIPKKSSVRSDQTRKLAEARREFQLKFGTKKPERHKLTMMDLIFYNPDSNHMVEEVKETVDDPKEEEENQNKVEREAINLSNDTPPQDEQENNDEESAMPVPQIKIGPSGELIIDEQSLVIERKEVTQQREEMAKTKIVNGDFDTGYGIYKKHKRTKKWTQQETVRFYKAINIIGTDFTLMTELFPNRTRRELKMKFKKEENLNNSLMNRAVMQPVDFDFDELKNEVELEEKEMEELQKQKEYEIKLKEEERKMSQEKMTERAKKRKIVELEKEANLKLNKPPKPKSQPRLPKKAKKETLSFVQDSDADESDIATQSESDEEIVMPQGPTRSGRIPKIVRKYEDDLTSVENVISRSRVPVHAKPKEVEPGSIMIISEVGPNGDPVYKIFMVTPDQTAQPLELSSDFITKAIELKKGVTAKNILTISASVTDDESEKPLVENNVTIAADENVTSLKSECSENDAENNDDIVSGICGKT